MEGHFLPTSKKEVEALGWDYLDVIIFTGDAYIDHPSFGTAVIARILEREGYRVAVVPQPNWRDDLRDFKKLGVPRLFFGVNAGAMDSMVNHYTANKRLRSDDAYTPEGKASYRPDYAVTVYSNILKKLYPEVPVVIGGIEASLRRLTHYDYWQDKLLPSVLVSSGADYLIYGMGERPIAALAAAIRDGKAQDIHTIPQVAYYYDASHTCGVNTLGNGKLWLPIRAAVERRGHACMHFPETERGEALLKREGTAAKRWEDFPSECIHVTSEQDQCIVLHSFEECLSSKRAFVENFNAMEGEANRRHARTLVEPCGDGAVVVNPPFAPATEAEMDSFFDLPFTKLPHPRYKGKRIPAYDMIKFSINIHHGCFGGCSFCTIAAHQGKFIQSRSVNNIVSEINKLVLHPDFKGVISDVGAPTANMYKMGGKDKKLCETCPRKSCLYPKMCPNLDHSHQKLLELYKAIEGVKGIKHFYIGSGIRYDLFLGENGYLDDTSYPYLKDLIVKHTSGRLKVAPEHTQDCVLKYMSKPSFNLFIALRKEFNRIVEKSGLRYQLVPYFISSHPGCRMSDMEALSRNPHIKGLYMEQVQDFTPTPMTASSAMYYSGMDLKTFKPIFMEKNQDKKRLQKSFLLKK